MKYLPSFLVMIGVAGCGTHEATDTDHHYPDDHVAISDHAQTDDHGAISDHAQTDDHGAISDHAQTDDHGAIADQVQIGDQVPDFEVTLNGKQWKLSALRKESKRTGDGTIVLTFWCSVCHSCRDIERALDALAKKYQGQAGVFALDATASETAAKVNRFVKQHGLAFPVALDPASQTPRVFGTQRTTTTMIIDRQGILRYCGQFADATHPYAENALRELLAGGEITVTTTPHRG